MNLFIEQAKQCQALLNQNMSVTEIAARMQLSRHQVRRRLKSQKRREKLDPALLDDLEQRGVVDLSGLHSGWLMNKDSSGSGSSLYFYLGPDQEKISFADAVRDVLCEIPSLPSISTIIPRERQISGQGYANVIGLADLHVGSDYGDGQLEIDVSAAIDDLIVRMPPAEKAILVELGDLLDANDHKGVTPASGNPCDVRHNNVLENTISAIRILRNAIIRLKETHEEVEVHLIKGNHDISAYVGVLLALESYFRETPGVKIIVTDEEYRVIRWGQCGFFPHHGDTIKAHQLKDVWADQFADDWAACRVWRLIMTGHLHHHKSVDLVGCVAEQFRTLHRPNDWAKSRGYFSYASLCAITVHKDRGEEYRTISSIKPLYKGKM